MSVITDKKLINDTQGFIASAGGDYTFSPDRDLYVYTPGIGTHDFSLSTADDRVDFYTADVVSYSDYYPFGMQMPGRSGGSSDYRYGMNGQESVDEVSGSKSHYIAEFWMYDSRIGRRWNLDPVDQIGISNYACFTNNPIITSDVKGDKPSTDVTKNDDGTYTVVNAKNDGDNNVYVVDDKGDRTGEVVANTVMPWDFMSTNNQTGEFYFDKTETGVTFDINDLGISATFDYSAPAWYGERKIHTSIKDADATQLARTLVQIFKDKTYGIDLAAYQLVQLMMLSANDQILDVKSSLGLHPYTPVLSHKGSENVPPTITTLRAVGNWVFGMNLSLTFPATSILFGYTESAYYKFTMPVVGFYNQYTNSGNGYNSGWPFYGEHTYSGTYIYYGYFDKKP